MSVSQSSTVCDIPNDSHGEKEKSRESKPKDTIETNEQKK